MKNVPGLTSCHRRVVSRNTRSTRASRALRLRQITGSGCTGPSVSASAWAPSGWLRLGVARWRRCLTVLCIADSCGRTRLMSGRRLAHAGLTTRWLLLDLGTGLAVLDGHGGTGTLAHGGLGLAQPGATRAGLGPSSWLLEHGAGCLGLRHAIHLTFVVEFWPGGYR